MDTTQNISALSLPAVRHQMVSAQICPPCQPANVERTTSTMAIPGPRQEHVPPPLPPPRYNHELAQGYDIGWDYQNDHLDGQRANVTSLKPGSSLLGSHSCSSLGTSEVEDEESDVNHKDFDNLGRTASDSQTRNPYGVGFYSSYGMQEAAASSLTHEFRGDVPLAHQSHHQSTNAYDKHLLLKIGKSGSPSRPTQMPNDKELRTKALAIRTNFYNNPLSRENTRSPMSPSSLLSPNSSHSWHDHNLSLMSPTSDGMSTFHTEDAGIGRVLSLPRISPSLSQEDMRNRSERGSYDSVMTSTETDILVDDAAFGNFEVDERPRAKSVHQGTKKRPLLATERQTMNAIPSAHDPRLQSRIKLSHDASPAKSEAPSSAISSTPSSSIASHYYASHHSSYTSLSSTGTSFGQNIASRVEEDSRLPSVPLFSQKQMGRIDIPTSSTPEASGLIRSADTPPDHRRIGNYFLCSCCPKKPRRFDTEEHLKAHENEKQYGCAYCNNRFKNKNEAERHQNSLHVRKHSWSCAALSTYQAAFHPSFTSNSAHRSSDMCGFCGQEFPTQPVDWEARIEHLINMHKFGECNSNKKFFRADHFRQHLKHSHGGKTGKWTNILENNCQREESSDSTVSSPTASEHQQSGRRNNSLHVGWPNPSQTNSVGVETIDEVGEAP